MAFRGKTRINPRLELVKIIVFGKFVLQSSNYWEKTARVRLNNY